jgi:predicted unusual protein kinase regulating ubiquinone biosynthesis (AarF/ABC1/UbiB family)
MKILIGICAYLAVSEAFNPQGISKIAIVTAVNTADSNYDDLLQKQSSFDAHVVTKLAKTLEALSQSSADTKIKLDEIARKGMDSLAGYSSYLRDLAPSSMLAQTDAEWIEKAIAPSSLPFEIGLAFATAGLIAALSSPAASRPTRPYTGSEYNAEDARRYFATKPATVFLRSIQILGGSFSFCLQLVSDYLSQKLLDPATEKRRADEVTRLLTTLGPTFIKIGQSLSIRRDLLRPAYLDALSKLQDQVPPFPSRDAVKIIEAELQRPILSVFSSGLSAGEQVVAAASLGQVYRARLATDGREVAVKVQRPDILENIALDMHILRSIAPVVKSIAGLQSDLVGIADDWGTGFVNELDYLKEAINGELFTQSIAKTTMKEAVFAPGVLRSLCTPRVLVTEWVQGVRLDKSTPSELTAACATAMTAYLTMMLETGVLHCDPHPGNLLKTPDGRLCILDWGLVTNLDFDLQLTFIEHIAHLTSKDFEKVPEDLVKLGFIPAGKETVALESGVVSVLAEVYTEFAGGGGLNKIDVNQVIAKLGGLADTYGNIFQVIFAWIKALSFIYSHEF